MRTQTPEHGSALREAEEWLRETLSEPTSASDVIRMAEAAGISGKTLRRASESLRIVKHKAGMNAGWVWSLPSKMPKPGEDAQQNRLGTFGESGHLREPDAPKMFKPAEDVQQNYLDTFGKVGHLREPDEMTEVEI